MPGNTQDQYKELLIALGGVIIVFLLLAGLIVLFVLRYQKRRLQYRHALEAMQLKNEEEILLAKLESQEETLGMIARELHDNIGQLMNSAKVMIGLTQRKQDQPSETLNAADETLAKAIQELRGLAKVLNKEFLERFDFSENLQTEIARIRSSGVLQIEMQEAPFVPLTPEKQLLLFRIVQELLQNVLKHAQASLLTVAISRQTGWLKLVVEDDGNGMKEGGSYGGMGLANVQHRVRMLGGEVNWLAVQPHGTRVAITVPVIETLSKEE